MSELRVLHCITGMTGDGAQRKLLRLASGLGAYGVRSEVINLGPDDTLVRSFEDLGIRVWSLGVSSSALGFARGVYSTRSLIESLNPDLIQGWMYHANIVVSSARSIARQGRVPVLWNIRRGLDDLAERSAKTRWVVRASAATSRAAERIIYCSERCKIQHESYGFDSGAACVIENGFDLTRFQPSELLRRETRKRYAVPDDAILIGCIGRYDVAKGHSYLMEAFARLAPRHPKLRLLMAGRGVEPSNDSLLSIAKRAGCADRVLMLGEQPSTDRIYPALDIYCSSSLNEGFPNALSEAMACGVPCVATDTGASRELVEGSGVVVPLRSVDGLAAGIEKLATLSSARRTELGERSRKLIATKFSLDRVLQRYFELYAEIASGSDTRRSAPAIG